MKRYSLLALLSLFVLFSRAQVLKKVSISNSGCTLYTYCDFKFEMSYSQDSSKVFASECEKDGMTYGVICVKLIQVAYNLDMPPAQPQ